MAGDRKALAELRDAALTAEQRSKAEQRLHQSQRLLDHHSEEAHPGHGPDSYAKTACPDVYEGVEYHGFRYWNKKSKDGSDCEAIALLSDTDRQLATRFETEGGIALCLSSAFKKAKAMRKTAKEGVPKDYGMDEGAVSSWTKAHLKIANELEEHEALSRRVWSEVEFEGGDAENKELIQRLEQQFAQQLVETAKEKAAEPPEESAKPPWGEPVERIGTLCFQCEKQSEKDKPHYYGTDEFKDHTYCDNCWGDWYGVKPSVWKEEHFEPSALLKPECRVLDDDDGIAKLRPSGAAFMADDHVEVRVVTKDGSSCWCPGTVVTNKLHDGTYSVDVNDAGEEIVIPENLRLVLAADGIEAPQAANGHKKKADISFDESSMMPLAQLLPSEKLTAVLDRACNLGVALDLVGAYLKLYEIDKADAVLSRVLPMCRQRSSVWQVKGLNLLILLRGKQARHEEQLAALQEMEKIIPFEPSAELGWQFYDIFYRNYACTLRALERSEEALEYSWKAVTVKTDAGQAATWFDMWDIGLAHSRIGQFHNSTGEMRKGHDFICKALEIHRKVEPNCTIIIAKILDSAGQCCLILGDHGEEHERQRWYVDGNRYMQEAYEIFMKTCGPLKPLTGWMAQNYAHATDRLKDYEASRKLLHHALKVEAHKDIITVTGLLELLDRVMECHQNKGDLKSLCMYESELNVSLDNLRMRHVRQADPQAYATLLQKIASFLMVSDDGSMGNFACALELLNEAREVLLECPGDSSEILDRVENSIRVIEIVFKRNPGNEAGELQNSSSGWSVAAARRNVEADAQSKPKKDEWTTDANVNVQDDIDDAEDAD
eukprot:gnl/MRDRNA2_/MRDRNA2_66650_c0_seq1.p1 gnl/MRDRNA2_/MRDRNA2_66650_c0~~gnl/MRDRNA2_/MRDRNA2_66650_c0_seq1.p1  ORF type:complete len:919 (+),score=205.95 gnl/MRDRNA2_/MRDRNA2_66650_c0_seq1:266-2758(+)